MKISEADLKLAEEAWKQAKEGAILSQGCLARQQSSEKELTASFITLGWSHQKATQEVTRIMKEHWDTLEKATRHYQTLDDLCKRLYERFKAQKVEEERGT